MQAVGLSLLFYSYNGSLEGFRTQFGACISGTQASTLQHTARRDPQAERVTDLEQELARLRRNQVADSLEIDRQKVRARARARSGVMWKMMEGVRGCC